MLFVFCELWGAVGPVGERRCVEQPILLLSVTCELCVNVCVCVCVCMCDCMCSYRYGYGCDLVEVLSMCILVLWCSYGVLVCW